MNTSFQVHMDWPEYAAVGRSVEGRIVNAPSWINKCCFSTHTVKKIAVTIQRLGCDQGGFATVKKVMEFIYLIQSQRFGH